MLGYGGVVSKKYPKRSLDKLRSVVLTVAGRGKQDAASVFRRRSSSFGISESKIFYSRRKTASWFTAGVEKNDACP
jgi:hypothetical protein